MSMPNLSVYKETKEKAKTKADLPVRPWVVNVWVAIQVSVMRKWMSYCESSLWVLSVRDLLVKVLSSLLHDCLDSSEKMNAFRPYIHTCTHQVVKATKQHW